MSKILSYDTKPEKLIRKILSELGFCYRSHVKTLPGKPDIVLSKYKAIIFVHGCFWHLHSGCRDGTIPKTRTAYWRNKLLHNKERDAKYISELKRRGWKVLRLWECDIENRPQKVIQKIKELLV